MPDEKKSEPRTHLAYAAGKGTQVSISGFGVATYDRPCPITTTAAAELTRNRKLRIVPREAPEKAKKPAAPQPETARKPTASSSPARKDEA